MRSRDADDDLDDEAWPARNDDQETDTIPCPHCRTPIFEEAEQCPVCGTYVTDEGSERQGKPWWIVVGTVACLVVVYFWIRYGT